MSKLIRAEAVRQALLDQYVEVESGGSMPGDGSQLLDGKWYVPRFGMDTLDHILDALLAEAQSGEPGPLEFEKPEGTWCPECGPGVKVDEEGLCVSCGATAIGNGANAALRALARPTKAKAKAGWKCKANRHADPPQDCEWPTCGCDPYAYKVIDALEEQGFNFTRPAPAVTADVVKLREQIALMAIGWTDVDDRVVQDLRAILSGAALAAKESER